MKLRKPMNQCKMVHCGTRMYDPKLDDGPSFYKREFGLETSSNTSLALSLWGLVGFGMAWCWAGGLMALATYDATDVSH